MTTRPIVSPLAAASHAIMAAAAHAQGVSGDLARLQGRWWMRIPSTNGGPSNVRFMEIKGDRATALDARGNVTRTARIRLDESANPKAIDFVDAVLGDPAKERQVKQPDNIGVYEVDGETFRFAINAGRNPTRRPRAVAPDAPANVILMVFRRGQPPAGPAATRVETFERAIVMGFVGQDIHFRTA
jgi:uncharacterized protein (TIGR03067 family)